ncbi:MAG: SH3 domain-containing protein [Bryobacteraceae bacterium]
MVRFFPLLAALFLLTGCSTGPPRAPEIGEAYAGPAVLKLRREIDLRSPEVVAVAHGDRLAIVGRRRRFVKVRTASGVEGWTDMRQLLSAPQMDQLNQLAETARQLPSQGAATVYEALNVHTEANRQAPSFYRIKEGEAVDVVAHQLDPRLPFAPKSILPPPTPRPKPSPKPADQSRVPRPPAPPPLKPPADWQELSKTAPLPDDEKEEADEPEPAKPIPVDDWILVRLKNGRAGWVLAGSLKMDITDEVAQYSEGHRITSYFATADVNDGGQIKHNWLWTTVGGDHLPYEFDSFRYFIWNVRHHRYETAHVESNLKGFYPVQVHPVQAAAGNKTATYPGFSLIVEENGVRYRKTYAYQIYLVHLVAKEKIETPPMPALAPAIPPPPAKPQSTPGFFARLKALFSRKSR